MISRESKLLVFDNSGVVLVRCIGLLKGKSCRVLGTVVVSTVKLKSFSNKVNQKGKRKKLVKGEIVYGFLTHTKKETRRFSGTYIRFSKNSVVLVSKEKLTFYGTRIKYPLLFETFFKNKKLTSLGTFFV